MSSITAIHSSVSPVVQQPPQRRVAFAGGNDSFLGPTSVSAPKFGGLWGDMKGAWQSINKAATNPKEKEVLWAWSHKYLWPNVARTGLLFVPVIGWILIPILNMTLFKQWEKKGDAIIEKVSKNGGDKALGVSINKVMDGFLEPEKTSSFGNVRDGFNSIMDHFSESNSSNKNVFQQLKLLEGKKSTESVKAFFGLTHYLQGAWYRKVGGAIVKGSFKLARSFKPLMPLVIGMNALIAYALKGRILKSMETVAKAAAKA